MRHPETLNQPIVLADQAEEVDQESDTVETIKLTEQWSEYFQEKCASMFIAPVKGSWIINGIPLSESKGYRRGIDTLLLFEKNVHSGIKTLSSTVTRLTTRWLSIPSTHQILIVAPTNEEKRILKSEDIIQISDLPHEEAYCINFQLHCQTNEAQSRGPNLLNIRVFAPKTKALEFLEDIKQDPTLFSEILKSMYVGIDNPDITYPIEKLTVFSQNPEQGTKIDRDDFDFSSKEK